MARLAVERTIPHPLNNTVYAAPRLPGENSSRGTAVSQCRHARRHTAWQPCDQEVRWQG